jgi:ABC-2 type transport system ATP-binding protein
MRDRSRIPDDGGSAGVPTVVVAERVSKLYGGFKLFGGNGAPARYALRDVSFSLCQGETLGLLGPNGAGKTTLLKIIATLLYPTSGRVLVHGCDVSKNSVEVRRYMGLVTSDERSFYWRLTGRQNLFFFAALYGVPQDDAEQKIVTLLEVLDLTAAADRPFLGYSSGMRQKLAIARGLLKEPRIVLYDEPTRSLDPISAQQIRKWIQENQTRVPQQTHLLATNQLQEAEQLCHRVIIINQGSVIAFGTIDQIRENWRKHDYAIHRITCRDFHLHGTLHPAPEMGLLDIVREPVGSDIVILSLRTLKHSDALHQVLATIVRLGGKIVDCDSEEVSFDDIFCALVAADRPDSKVEVPGVVS